MERCAQAAIDLENGTGVEEVDEEDDEQEIELGKSTTRSFHLLKPP